MKSITPVVSVILMVLITVVASVSAFFFINSSVSDLQSQGNLDTNPVMDNSRLNLVSITGSKAIVRNDGTSPVTQAIVFVNGELLNFELDPPILPGQLREIEYDLQVVGEDLEIKIIYNAGKTVSLISPASKNTETSGFVESTESDYSSSNCLNNDSSNIWFTGSINGSNSACCGDDRTLDDFYNSTNYCCDGVLDTGTCHCGDGTCQSWENIGDCLIDCNTIYVDNVGVIFVSTGNYDQGVVATCNAGSAQGDILKHYYSWSQNGSDLLSDFEFLEGIIVTGSTHTCGILSNNSGICWGSDSSGKLGNGDRGNSLIPDFIEGNYLFKDISLGEGHTCGILTNGSAVCWGTDTAGQLGNGAGGSSLVPDFVEGDYLFKQISAGQQFSCGVLVNGSGVCWGDDGSGKLGNGDRGNSNIPDFIEGDYLFKSIICATSFGHHACGVLVNGSGVCWGNNDGTFGNGVETDSQVPVFVSGNYNFNSIDTNGYHTCGVLSDESMLCWGYNDHGQLGNESIGGYSNVPVYVSGGYNFTNICVGSAHTCGTLINGTALCWGAGSHGELGNGNFSDSYVPTSVSGEYFFDSINGGSSYSCGTLTNGTAVCWGWNPLGKLGDNSINDSNIPVFVSGNYDFINNNNYWDTNATISYLYSDYYVGDGNSLTLNCSVVNNVSSSASKQASLTIPDGDVSIGNCNSWNSDWLTGTINGSNGPCCGDDNNLDEFHNNSYYCCNEMLNLGDCFLADSTCQGWENSLNSNDDCNGWSDEFDIHYDWTSSNTKIVAYNSEVYTIVVKNSDIVFRKSENYGLNWNNDLSLSASNPSHLNIAVNEDGHIYVVWLNSVDDSLYFSKSTNAGVSFSSESLVTALADSSATPYPELCVSDDNIFIVWNDGLFSGNYYFTQSLNGGTNWDSASELQSSIDGYTTYFRDVSCNDSNVYVAYLDNGVYLENSSDGSSWTRTQISSDLADYVTLSIYGETLYVGYDKPSGGYFIKNSTNGGVTWSSEHIISTDTGLEYMSIYFDGNESVYAFWTNNSRYTVNAALSTDRGITWSIPVSDDVSRLSYFDLDTSAFASNSNYISWDFGDYIYVKKFKYE
jgi:alpha-tubulin suppressor-like RCC1 family protein